MHGQTGESGGSDAAGWGRATAEWLLMFAIFAAAAAWPAPDVNEAVYLTKARHAADPGWCSGDFFLQTPDAHGLFYVVMGPLAAALPLERAAWMGRIAGWLLLAIGFRRAAVPLLATSWARVAAAAMFAVALRHTTAAGEWVIGGCEAKVFAWAAVLGSLGDLVRGGCASAWFRCGIAAAFHPIVGGWAMVATAAVWLREAVESRRSAARSSRRPWGGHGWRDAALVAGGVAAAAVGVVPAIGLTAGVEQATRIAAARIYVVDRLAHHLLPRTFADGMIARHLLAVVVWWLLVRMLEASAPRRRLTAFTLAALAISAAGVAIALIEPWSPTTAYALLRYYWFRLADVAVPFALATAVAAVVEDPGTCRRLLPCSPPWGRAALIALLVLDLALQSFHWPLPGRDVPPRADAKVAAAAWAETCDWVRGHTPPDACFLTPRGSASFTWRTDRREVVSWKNSPQDAASLVAWRRRIVDCFSRTGSLAEMERSTASLGAARLREVAARYAADHLIVPVDVPLLDAIPGERVHANAAYAVYRLTSP
ncbi:MAG: DUF6798 domain-containing protein [Planctomycetaceae bacterium]